MRLVLLVSVLSSVAFAQLTPAQKAEARRAQRNYSYNVDQALISVGSGGLTGKGWRDGTQNALGYLPRAVAHNDFIFSVIAEEKGFRHVASGPLVRSSYHAADFKPELDLVGHETVPARI